MQDFSVLQATTSQLWMPIFRIHLNFLSRCMPKSKKVTTLSGLVVLTARVNRRFVPFAKAFYWLINKVSDTELVDGARDFRLMTRQVVDAILELKEVNRFSKGLFSWVGFDVAYVSYENRERVAGETSWSLEIIELFS